MKNNNQVKKVRLTRKCLIQLKIKWLTSRLINIGRAASSAKFINYIQLYDSLCKKHKILRDKVNNLKAKI